MNAAAKPKRRKKTLRSIMAMFATLALVVIAHLYDIPFPATLADKISTWNSSQEFSVEVADISLSLSSRTLNVGSVKIYVKGSVDDPFVEIKKAEFRLAPGFSKLDARWLRSVSIGRLVVSDAVADTDSALYAERRSGVAATADAEQFPDFDVIPFFVESARVCGIDGIVGETKFSAKDGVIRFGDIKAVFAGGKENANCEMAFDTVKHHISVKCKGDITPKTMMPLFVALQLPRLCEILSSFDFPDVPPKVSFALDCALDKRDGEMRVDVGSANPCSYRSIPVSSFSGVITSSGTNLWRRVAITDLGLRRPEGSAYGSLQIDMADRAITFTGESKMEPLNFAVLAHIMKKLPEAPLPFSFPAPPHVKASGVYDLASDCDDRTDIVGTIVAPRIAFTNDGFVENVTSRLFLKGAALNLDQIKADAFDGKITGAAALAISNRAFSVTVKLDGLRRAKFAPLADNYDAAETKGALNSAFGISGIIATNRADTLRTLTGGGKITLKDADIYRVPLFAGLTGFLSRYVPGVDFLVAQDTLETEFELSSDSVRITNMEIIGAVFSASAKGWVDYDGNINIRLKGHLMNNKTWIGAGLRYVLFPISKVFEFRAEGSYEEPKWSSVTF